MTPHVAPYVTSPCLSIAEHVNASGKDLILALILAHEIGGRISASLAELKVLKEDPPYYEEPSRYTHAYSFLGGVAGACKLLGLSDENMTNAFGIAGASAPVPATMKVWKNLGPKVMVKYNAWSGWASQLSTVAVLLADKGFTGDPAILDGEWGFWKIVGSPFFKVDKLFMGLGEIWHIGEVWFKPYPTCALTHAGLEGINNILKEHDIKPNDIEEILVKGDPLLLTPNRTGVEVKSFADVQFANAPILLLELTTPES